MKTAEQRVARGIAWLNMDEATPKNWRSILNVEDLRFANPDKGPLGQLFGDYLTGLKKLGIVGGADFLGFRTEYAKRGDPADLKTAWEHALRTENSWQHLGNNITRVIRGVRYLIYKDGDKTKVMQFIAGQAICFARSYCSYDSAKRSVRKVTSKV